MKKILIFILCVTVLLYHFVTSAQAIYDPRTVPNNKAGVHILSPEEIDDAAKLVNSNGGDWGYVIIPIQPTDRDKIKLQSFMDKAKEKHVIPIIRITTLPKGGTWATAHDTDLVDFANFLGELDWPIENKYLVLFNEVNRSTEWGDAVDPEKYASIVKNAYAIFKERSPNFFIIGPSLDLALPNSSTSLSAQNYLSRMRVYDPLVFTYFDGWSSHSYPNPGFVAPAKKTGLQSIVGYRSELLYLNLAPKPVFITETGWDQTKISDGILANYWSSAWQTWSKDVNVVAVTPFVLRGGQQYKIFSLIKDDGQYSVSGQSIFNLPKSTGNPKITESVTKSVVLSSPKQPSWTIPFFKNSHVLYKLENIFRVILGLPIKQSAKLKDLDITIELAKNSSQWEKGLSNRADLGDTDGMLFVFPQYHIPVFWMKDMKFPLDIIWIASGKVVDITYDVKVETVDKLPTYSPLVPVNMILETRAGWAAENNIVLGDQLVLSD
ncbi:hypothetical protein COT87_00595 [Candidatus Collierbacteria bacterium CG10_big_fil_rev_8_21_14_0_10_44_9]|uniref:DUF192 domain-containing protein n=1 Tax=Candidatus Collierbacteria bacterium CG10_big_fil_rev_8_21_14_0_10_44_9 TaxID=1974535 RepID=A0A2H0VLL8_9BACT|nr:MAG: hypothetical protein COT87_00595 [Candidatus Collierbacteria bacterium CG10_big_fil_rev_8_21_14_0_10_44_9]